MPLSPVATPTADPFAAIAEPRRRRILERLAAAGPSAVGALVLALGIPQPDVSKHLRVLHEAGLVTVERHGRSRTYQLNPAELEAIHRWISSFERFWTHHTDRISRRAEAKAARRLANEVAPPASPPPAGTVHPYFASRA